MSNKVSNYRLDRFGLVLAHTLALFERSDWRGDWFGQLIRGTG